MTPFPNISRRRFLLTSAGLLAATGLESSCCGSNKHRKIPVAVQLYTVRDKLEKEFFQTLEAIAKIGYDGVEFWKFFGHTARDIRQCMDDNGLLPAGAHTDLETVLGEQLERTINFHQILGNHTLIVPWLPENMRSSRETWLKTADLFNDLSDKLTSAGMRIGYHNHEMEFELIDGEMPWDIFASATRPEVILQFDTGNAADKNVDVVSFLKKYPGRSVTIHLKEHSASNPNALIGEGDIPFKEIIRVCRGIGGTEWFILEEEKDAYPPLVGAEKSYQNFINILKSV
jgi:sugar phosphate isomerase/epimerase